MEKESPCKHQTQSELALLISYKVDFMTTDIRDTDLS